MSRWKTSHQFNSDCTDIFLSSCFKFMSWIQVVSVNFINILCLAFFLLYWTEQGRVTGKRREREEEEDVRQSAAGRTRSREFLCRGQQICNFSHCCSIITTKLHIMVKLTSFWSPRLKADLLSVVTVLIPKSCFENGKSLRVIAGPTLVLKPTISEAKDRGSSVFPSVT